MATRKPARKKRAIASTAKTARKVTFKKAPAKRKPAVRKAAPKRKPAARRPAAKRAPVKKQFAHILYVKRSAAGAWTSFLGGHSVEQLNVIKSAMEESHPKLSFEVW